MTRAIRRIVVAGLLVLPFPSAHAQRLQGLASVDSSRYLVGDWINVRVELRHPKGTTFQPGLEDTIPGFVILRRLPMTPVSDTVTRTGVVIARYDSGSGRIPGFRFLAGVPGDTALHPVSTNPVTVTVQTVEVDTSKDFRDLKPPMSIPYTLAEILGAVAVLLVIGLAGYLLYRWYRRRKQRPARAVTSVPSKPAHVIALEELGRLKERKLWQQGKIKEYYSDLSQILRQYVENRYGLMALEETTDEIIDGLRRMRLLPRLVDQVDGVLRLSDLVKFAKHSPDIRAHDESMKAVYDIVERTKVPTAAASSPEHRKAEHVGS